MINVMEGVDQGRRVCREVSRQRGKMFVDMMKPPLNKVEVVYYLSRSNGHLEHPHYIEVTHLPHQQLRLKDVLDRLTVLRGKGMPSLYSWSCKRSYKNGYVWNDLGPNDVIFPLGGGEYVLKGSELPLDNCTEKLHHLQLANAKHFQHENNHHRNQDTTFHPKRRFIPSKRQTNHQETTNNQFNHHPLETEYEEKTMHARCSRGVSTEEQFNHKHSQALETNSPTSPPSTTTSSDTNPTDHKDVDPIGNEPMLSRNSMLFSLIACGGSGSFRKNELPPLPPRKSCSNRLQAKMVAAGEVQDLEMIRYMSENPRFGNLQAEVKEYFSGSIVECIANHETLAAPHNGFMKSSSYNQQRSSKAGLGEVADEEVKEEKGVKGKCIPRKKKKKSTSKQSKI